MPRISSRKKATIKDVARQAGVSVGTVSRVINDKEGTRPSTKGKVLKAMEELNYQPEVAARELSFGSGTLIGINEIIMGSSHHLKGPFYNRFFLTMLEEAFKCGFRVREIPASDNGMPSFLPDAMVILGAHDADPRLEYLEEAGVPFVLIGRGLYSSWVTGDDVSGGYQAGKHLLKLGHRDILHFTSHMTGQVAQDRYKGFLQALGEAGVPHRPEFLVSELFTPLDSYRAMRQYLDEKGRIFSAVFAGSDEIAQGVRTALEDSGISVPGDISIVGYDDLPEIAYDLTTVHQDIPLLASSALSILKDLLAGGESRSELMPVQLIARKTTARKRD